MWNFVQKAPKTWVQIRLNPQVCNFSQQEPQRNVFGSNLQQNGTFWYKKYCILLCMSHTLLCITLYFALIASKIECVKLLLKNLQKHGFKLA